MGIVSIDDFGADPVTITGPSLDNKVNPLVTEFNGSIDNDNIKAAAGIVYSKLNLTGNILNADISASAAIVASKLDLSSVAQKIVMTSKAIDEAKASDLASASTVDVGTATGNLVHVTGTTAITSLGTSQAGVERNLVFDGALTFTHNASSLILPTAGNITTVAGDTAIMRSEGSGNWRCIAYNRAAGTPLTTSISAKAGSFTRDISTATGTQAVTGVGFTPKALLFFGGVNGTANFTWGFATASNTGVSFDDNATSAGTYGVATSSAIRIEVNGSSARYEGNISSLDSDGFTISWVKTGTPTGTATITYLAIR